MSPLSLNRRHFMGTAASITALLATSARAETNPLGPPPPLTLYGDLPAIDHLDLSADGGKIVMASGRGTARSLIVYDLQSQKAAKQPIGDIKLRSVSWIDKSHLLIESSLTSTLAMFSDVQQELFTAIALNYETGKARSIYGNMADYFPVLGSDASVIRTDKKAYVLAGGITRVKYLRILNRFDPETGNASQVDEGGPDTTDWVINAEGGLVARENYRRETYTWSLEMNRGGWKTVMTEKAELDYPSLVGLGRSPQTAAIYFNQGDRANRYYEVTQDGTLTPMFEDAKGSISLLRHPKTHTVVGYATHGHWISYSYTDPQLAKLTEQVGSIFTGYRTSIVSLADDCQKAIIYSEGPDDAGTYFFVNFETGENVRLGQAYPDLPAAWITEKVPFTYKASDGLEIEAYLTLPPGRSPEKLPLIVLPHGGPQSRDTLGFDWGVNAYASRGYAILQPNFRGSDGYGDAFVEKGYGEWGRKMQTDLSDGVRHLAAKGIIDPSRVCIAGYSYGGYAAMAGAAFDPGIYRCAASYGGVSDLRSMMVSEGKQSGDRNNHAIRYWKRYLGDPTKWDAASPLRNTDKVTIPLLLIHGKDDTVVDYMQSKLMAEALQKAGKPVELVTLSGEDHWLSRSETRLTMLTAIVAFIEKYNPAY